jgi:hypothetical protein
VTDVAGVFIVASCERVKQARKAFLKVNRAVDMASIVGGDAETDGVIEELGSERTKVRRDEREAAELTSWALDENGDR